MLLEYRHYLSRVQHDPHNKRPVRGVPNSDFFPVHPMADEDMLLERLCLAPAQCISVDGYWRLGKRVHFVQVWGRHVGTGREPGLYAARPMWQRGKRTLSLVAATDHEAITWDHVQTALNGFARILSRRTFVWPESTALKRIG